MKLYINDVVKFKTSESDEYYGVITGYTVDLNSKTFIIRGNDIDYQNILESDVIVKYNESKPRGKSYKKEVTTS